MRHSYLGTMIDAEVVHSQARSRMTENRDPGSTVVHHHGSNKPCKEREHTIYDHNDQTVKDKVFIEDGYAMWSIPDPAMKH
jgi:hypothetical protein